MAKPILRFRKVRSTITAAGRAAAETKVVAPRRPRKSPEEPRQPKSLAPKTTSKGTQTKATPKKGTAAKGPKKAVAKKSAPKAAKPAAKKAPKDNKGPFGASKAGTARLRAEAKRGAERNKVIAGLKELSKQYGGEGAARGAKGTKYAGGTNATGGGP